MRTTSIRFRLTSWYLLCLCSILAIFGFGARLALQNSTQAAVDHGLNLRLDDVRDFVVQQTKVNPARLVHELREQVQTGLGGGLVDLWNESGDLLFRAAGVTEAQLGSTARPQPAGRETNFSTIGPKEADARAAVRSFEANGARYTARVIQPMHAFDESLARFDRLLLLGAPLLLISAAIGGYWISGRALAPVDRLTRDAESIGIVNLSQRLAVPPANDELTRLALTLNKMLERLESSVERLTRFTADASHELRAPLTLVQTAAEFSLRAQRSPEESREAFRKILRESERMTKLIEDLLTLARGDSAANALEFAPVDVSYVVSAALDSIRSAAEAKSLTLKVSLPADPVFVPGDEPALIRLLVILLDNAVKYTDPGGWIDVSVERSGANMELSISDSGIGIRDEDVPLIWDRFWRADKVRSRNAGGAGLGLAIARSIAGVHGASLNVQSELGHGSRFIVRMPISGNDVHASHRRGP